MRQRVNGVLLRLRHRLPWPLILGLVSLVAAAFIAYTLFAHAGTLRKIQERGVWRVGMDPSFPPFENFDPVTGQPVGLDVELAQAIGARWGIQTKIIALGFDELLDAVAAHRVDAAISALPVQPERTKEVHFSDPYVQAGVVLAAVRGSEVTGSTDLGGRRVAVEWGSQGDAVARRLLNETKLEFELLPRETVTAALDALVSGEADAAIVDAISLATYAQAAQLVTLGAPLMSDPYVVLTAADAPDLGRAVNDALRGLESDGTLVDIRKRWLRPGNP